MTDDDQDRAVLFIDGSNWYHALQENGVVATERLDYATISEKLVGPREWVNTRYYGVSLNQDDDHDLYAKNRRFLSKIENDDSRITTHLGRVEPRPVDNPLADELGEFLQERRDLPEDVGRELVAMVRDHQKVEEYREKGVDVRLAVDMYRLANEDRYDAAYLLSADGDYTPAVEAVQDLGKTVYAVCPNFGSALNRTCKTFINLDSDWFDDCYRDQG